MLSRNVSKFFFSRMGKKRTAKVYIPEKYEAIPHYQKIEQRDIHDYKLRDRQTVVQEFEQSPPENVKMSFSFTRYNEAVFEAADRNRKVKCEIDISTLKLTPLQKDRLIILLGPRYKGSNKVTIAVDQYPEIDQNFEKLCDMIKQSYWEAKRAP